MPRVNMFPVTSNTRMEPQGMVTIRCHDCGHEYRAKRVEYICPLCEGDAGLAPQPAPSVV